MAEKTMTRQASVGTVSHAPLDVRFGLNLLVYTPTFPKDQVDLIRKVADFGYDGVEIPFTDLDVLDAAATRHAREEAGVGLTACAVLTEDANVSSPDAAERQKGVERLKRVVDLTAEMGGDAVGGPLYAPVRHLTGCACTDDEWKWAAEGLHAAAEHAAPSRIVLAIEPLNRFETYVVNTAADAVRLVQAVDHPNLKVQIDTFHGNIEEKDTAAAIRATGARIGHFHASESDRGVPGSGQVRWKECFAALREVDYRGWVTIESFATGIVDLCAAACIWRPIYDTADALAVDGLAFLKAMARIAWGAEDAETR
ncbi:MAG TPA: sugar phosphate isomerase/epimerase family protein [Candidatus Hydrogenedentes bacterium]|nr:sugar phosphate isomerase/epimerase family protein [Candidatus Hydrogenedentota bacterium]